MPDRQLIRVRAAGRRLGIARDLVASIEGEVVVIGASRGAADDFARSMAAQKAATFGVHRFSLPEFASRVGRLEAARDGVSPAASLMVDAVVAHVTHERASAGDLAYFNPVAGLAGFPRAVRRTLSEARQAGVAREELVRAPAVGGDLAALLDGYEAALEAFAISDITDLFRRATRVMEEAPPLFARQTVVLLDLPVRSAVVERFITSIVRSAALVIATEPADDVEACAFFEAADCEPLEEDEEEREEDTALGRVRRHLFAMDVEGGATDDTVRIFSAPGEGREAVEIARALLAEVRESAAASELAYFTPVAELAGFPAYRAADVVGGAQAGVARDEPVRAPAASRELAALLDGRRGAGSVRDLQHRKTLMTLARSFSLRAAVVIQFLSGTQLRSHWSTGRARDGS